VTGTWGSRWRRFDDANQRISDRIYGWAWRYLTPVAALFMLIFAGIDAGPSWQARFGEQGMRGVVVVTSEECTHMRYSGRTCDHYGNFRSDDGTDNRSHVLLATGFGLVKVGDRRIAYDTGDRAAIYPPNGGEDWAITGAFLLGGAALLAAWSFLVGRPMYRRFRGR